MNTILSWQQITNCLQKKNETRLDSAIEKLKKGNTFTIELLRSMKYILVDESWEDYLYLEQTDRKKLNRIKDLLKDIFKTPFEGLGKLEPLDYKYAGFWQCSLIDRSKNAVKSFCSGLTSID